MQQVRRPQRQDTFDLRDHIVTDDNNSTHMQAHADAAAGAAVVVVAPIHDEEQRSVLDDDSEDGDEGETYLDEDDDDGSSSLSIPNESIDFDLVYSLHSFAATVEGQANVVKGDRLFLIDDSNSYWWLVRVLKTQEVGYIPAENIETPFERLARLNKHRNVDLASATQAEMQGDLNASQDLLRSRTAGQTPSPVPGRGRSHVQFTASMSVHRYPPAVWNEEEMEEEDVEWDEGEYFGTDPDLAEEERVRSDLGPGGMEPDDEMQWDDSAVEEMQASAAAAAAAAAAASHQTSPDLLQPGAARGQQQMLAQQPQSQIFAQQQQQQQALQRQQQQQQEAITQQQQSQQAQWAARQQELRSPASRERLAAGQDASRADSLSPNPRQLDPADATVTVRKTITPTVARDDERAYTGPQEDDNAKRAREEEEEAARKRAKGREKVTSPAPSAQKPQAGKLRKEPSREIDNDAKEKKKRTGMWSGLFGSKKKEKSKEKSASIGSFDSSEIGGGIRESEESGKSSRPSGATSDGVVSPTTNLAIQQQQAATMLAGVDAKENPSTPERAPQVSQHASQLRQHDQQQQALYLQYLNRSPSSAPEAQPSYGLQSASAVLGGAYGAGPVTSGLGPPTSRPRPGSLIITSGSMDGSGPGVPELSVIRVFAGKNLQTEATFKTVLLNASTTSSDLVRQAIQRFRLPGGENQNDYYLTVKQIEGGSSAVLQHEEHPLVVFETLVTEAMEMPKVKRSSMGSISSVASNLSMHPAIKKLAMNDFTDDSAVKFYLNRKNEDGKEDSLLGHGDDTMIAETSHGETSDLASAGGGGPSKNQYLSVSTAGINVTPERFSSPSYRFPLQLVIYPEDLPEDMVFHPTTEAIVFKDQLRESEVSATTVVSPHMRRKVFMFPKNVTVAEVTELGLERFGILEGVVDGGDEVEDKLAKRRSSGRVRYGLWINVNGHDRELTPSSKVVDAFPRPPTFRSPERHSGSLKRRSVDSTQLLGNVEDVQADDPVFLLRRAISYRNSTSRHRMSAPLDEIALQHLHRESASSATMSEGSATTATGGTGDTTTTTTTTAAAQHHIPRQPSAQEIIAAQRAATRANQRAMISAQSNSLRGTDVLLPDNALLRSSRYDSSERMRYSYVEPDGETYDISDIVEAEWKEGGDSGNNDDNDGARIADQNDLLASVVSRSREEGLDENLGRVLNKIRNGKARGDLASSLDGGGDSRRESRNSMPSVSEYSVDDSVQAVSPMRSRSATPGSAGFVSKMPGAGGAPAGAGLSSGATMMVNAMAAMNAARGPSPNVDSAHAHTHSSSSAGSEERAPSSQRAGTVTPTGRPMGAVAVAERRQPSLASVMSDSTATAGYITPPPQPPHMHDSPRSFGSPSKSSTSMSTKRRGPVIPKDDFGISHMMAIIEYKAGQAKPRAVVDMDRGGGVDVVEERLFGPKVDLDKLHPKVRGIFEGGFKLLEEMDKVLDSYVQPSIGAF